MSTRRSIAVLLAGAALTISGCASLPPGPPPLPATFIPQLPATAAPVSIPVGADGFNVVEHVTMRVSVEGCDFYATGTGWALDEHTIVTNRHVIDGADEISLVSYDGDLYEGYDPAVAEFADLAIVTVDGELPEWATIATEAPEPGDQLTVVGFPEGGRLTTTTGEYVRLVEDTLDAGGADVYQVDVESWHGNSGSPVVNDEGEVVGVLYAGDEAGTSFVVSLDSLDRFLSDESEQLETNVTC